MDLFTEEEKVRNPKDVQAEIKKTRHKSELPLFWIMSVIGVVVVIAYIAMSSADQGLIKAITDFLEEAGIGAKGGSTAALAKFIVGIVAILSGIIVLIYFIITLIMSVYNYYAGVLSYAVRVSETNFPEIYEKVNEYAYLLGMKKAPEVYVAQQNGVINAFTSWIPGKTYIQLNAEIVDLAYMENKDFDTVYFVMAHEFGHAYLNHVNVFINIFVYMVMLIPVVGPSILYPLISRAREYSCDRVAQALTEGKNQEECMMMLGAGRHTYKYIDTQDYLKQINVKQNIITRFFRWCINLTASHPIMPFRVAAIEDPEKKSGRLI